MKLYKNIAKNDLFNRAITCIDAAVLALANFMIPISNFIAESIVIILLKNCFSPFK